jgi:hypothetical protein
MGFEPTTFAMARRRSSQLSYIRTRPAHSNRLFGRTPLSGGLLELALRPEGAGEQPGVVRAALVMQVAHGDDEHPTPEFMQEFDAARQRALPYLQGSA